MGITASFKMLPPISFEILDEIQYNIRRDLTGSVGPKLYVLLHSSIKDKQIR